MTEATPESADGGSPWLLGRVAVGLGLALQASEDFRDMEDTVSYAESAGVPMPDVLAPLASGTMVVAGVLIALWRLPRLATTAAAGFLVAVTTQMHDFWNADEDDKSGERLAFFGNLAMLGGVLLLLEKAFEG